MTKLELGKVLELLESYYKGFYSGNDKVKVFEAWYPMFQDDDAAEVNRAVVAYICTEKFAPTVAGIKGLMAEERMRGQMTEMEAWSSVREAIDKSSTKTKAIEAYNALSPVVRKVCGSPSMLAYWYKLTDQELETVVASNVQRSYREWARREAVYYAIPGQLQSKQQWRLGSEEKVALPPKPEQPKFEKPEWMIRREEKGLDTEGGYL